MRNWKQNFATWEKNERKSQAEQGGTYSCMPKDLQQKFYSAHLMIQSYKGCDGDISVEWKGQTLEEIKELLDIYWYDETEIPAEFKTTIDDINFFKFLEKKYEKQRNN